MSEHDEPGRSELERRLDVAFRETRPRRGFEDELWARLQARRPWWHRLGDRLERVHWAGVATGLAALVVVGLVVTLARGGPHGTSGGASTATAPKGAPAASGISRSETGGQAALPFGPLPAPPADGVVQPLRPAGPSALPEGSPGGALQSGSLPQASPGLAVYRYDAASGPPNGTILETSALPAALSSGIYPTRPAADALAAAQAPRGSGGSVAVSQARLVYVAVVSGSEGFLEPAYLFTGTSGSAPVQVLVSALAPAALR